MFRGSHRHCWPRSVCHNLHPFLRNDCRYTEEYATLRDQWVRCDLQYSFPTRTYLILPHLTPERVKDSSSFTRSLRGRRSSASRSSARPCSRSRDNDRYSCSSAISATNNTSARYLEKKVLPWLATLVADSWKLQQRRPRTWRNSSQIWSGCSARARRMSTA